MAKANNTTGQPHTKPILFSTEMVRALIDGKKTQTRRVMKVPPEYFAGGIHPDHAAKHPAPYIDAYCSKRKTPTNPRGMSDEWYWWTEDDRCGPFVGKCPYIPSDFLWVKETWRGVVQVNAPWEPHEEGVARYTPSRASCKGIEFKVSHIDNNEPWRSSIHMPRWASRLTLRITNIRVERLQDISEVDAQAEGVRSEDLGRYLLWSGRANERPTLQSAKQAFLDHVWIDLYGEHETKSVGANPWVWVYEFEVIQKNVDDVL